MFWSSLLGLDFKLALLWDPKGSLHESQGPITWETTLEEKAIGRLHPLFSTTNSVPWVSQRHWLSPYFATWCSHGLRTLPARQLPPDVAPWPWTEPWANINLFSLKVPRLSCCLLSHRKQISTIVYLSILSSQRTVGFWFNVSVVHLCLLPSMLRQGGKEGGKWNIP